MRTRSRCRPGVSSKKTKSTRYASGSGWGHHGPTRAPPPNVRDPTWAKHPIDAFILARLDQANLKPVPPTDKLTLLRRATYDLTGLPPTQAEIRTFLDDMSAQAFERVVDRLMASPRY